MIKSSLNEHDRTVSVIIPYYNGSKYIERSVQSVLDQTVKPNELLVIDDGSIQEESDFLNIIAKKMGFAVLRKENGGQGSARNFGVAHTKSKFICFLDQDDFFLPNHIKQLMDAVEWQDPKFGWVYGDLCEADEEGNIVQTNVVVRSTKDSHPKTSILTMLRYDMYVLPSASLISRRAFEDVGGFDPQFTGYEDDDFFLRLFRKGWTNYYLPKAVTVWCINNNSTSFSIKMSRSRLRYVKKICDNFDEVSGYGHRYIRDCLVPRFMGTFIKEARQAVKKPKTPQQIKMFEHRDEIISLLDQFIDVISKKTRLRGPVRRKLKCAVLKIKIEKTIKKIFLKY